MLLAIFNYLYLIIYAQGSIAIITRYKQISLKNNTFSNEFLYFAQIFI